MEKNYSYGTNRLKMWKKLKIQVWQLSKVFILEIQGNMWWMGGDYIIQ